MTRHLTLVALLVVLLSCFAPAQSNDPKSQPQTSNSQQENSSPASSPTDAKPASNFPDVYRVGGGIAPPSVTYAPDPEYSKKARKARYQGTVVLWLIVDRHGEPQRIRVQRSLGMGLDEEAVKAVQRWRFQPATKNGQPVAVMINVEINFRLYDSLHPHPDSSGQQPRFPGVDTSIYPLIVGTSEVSYSQAEAGQYANYKVTITEAGQQREMAISCPVASPQCLVLAKGVYPARWKDGTTTLEVLGLSGADPNNWKESEYTVANAEKKP